MPGKKNNSLFYKVILYESLEMRCNEQVDVIGNIHGQSIKNVLKCFKHLVQSFIASINLSHSLSHTLVTMMSVLITFAFYTSKLKNQNHLKISLFFFSEHPEMRKKKKRIKRVLLKTKNLHVYLKNKRKQCWHQ